MKRSQTAHHARLLIFIIGFLFVAANYGNASDANTETSAPYIAFLLDKATLGDMGGLSGADERCQAEAKAASLPGMFRAWLSDSTQNVRNRFENAGTRRPFIQVGGTKIADNWLDLIAGDLDAPITTTAKGEPGVLGLVWTGTELDDSDAMNVDNCNDWRELEGSGRTGTNIKSIGMGWSQFGGLGCRMEGLLYCFQTKK